MSMSRDMIRIDLAVASYDTPYFVVLLAPSSRSSLSIVIAWAGQMASHSLQARRRVLSASAMTRLKTGTYRCTFPPRLGTDVGHVHHGSAEKEGPSRTGT